MTYFAEFVEEFEEVFFDTILHGNNLDKFLELASKTKDCPEEYLSEIEDRFTILDADGSDDLIMNLLRVEYNECSEAWQFIEKEIRKEYVEYIDRKEEDRLATEKAIYFGY